MERPSSNSPPAPVRRSQRSTAGRKANKYGDWDTRSSSSSIPSSSMSTRERRLAEASRQKQAADDELRRKELAILRMELELERNINEREHQEQLAKIEQDERADFLLAQPLTSDLNERIHWIVEESTLAAPTPTATEVRSPRHNSNPVLRHGISTGEDISIHDHHQKCRKVANEASRASARDERASMISQEIVASLPTLAQRTLSREVKGSASGWLTVLGTATGGLRPRVHKNKSRQLLVVLL